MSKATPKKRARRRTIAAASVLGIVALGVVWWLAGGTEAGMSAGTTFVATRGDLDINILEGGSVEALESQEIRSQVEGREGTKILHIVEEGYQVTKDDVDNGKILVELDSAALRDQEVNQQIQVESAQADLIDRQASYDIQKNQNISDITAAQLNAKFARLDFEKYLGQGTVQKILHDLALDEREKQIQAYIDAQASRKPGESVPPTPSAAGRGPASRELTERPGIPLDDELIDAIASAMGENGMPAQPDRLKQMMRRGGDTVSPMMADRMKRMGIDIYAIAERLGKIPKHDAEVVPEDTQTEAAEQGADSFLSDPEYAAKRAAMDFSVYADVNALEDGEAKQKLRELDDSVNVAEQDRKLAESQLDGQKRLAEKDFITPTDLEVEKLKFRKTEIQVASANTAQKLYIAYEFPKQAEKLLSDYEEALMSLERSIKEAEAKLSQADARLKAAKRKYEIESDQLADFRRQIENTVIRAERPGMVVYGSSTGNSGFRGGNEEPIQEGTTVRERQLIITIPDMTKMGATVNVHESAVKQVRPGQKATIVVDANPSEPLSGEVVKVAVLPDSGNRWMNPDLKVYPTKIKIPEVVEWLRPGMSAQITIHVDTLKDVIYVPIQAVTARGDNRIVRVVSPAGVETRIVETGRFNDKFIEIKSGLEEGDVVQLVAPQIPTKAPENGGGQEQDKGEETEEA